jgi:hypothetical protein
MVAALAASTVARSERIIARPADTPFSSASVMPIV